MNGNKSKAGGGGSSGGGDSFWNKMKKASADVAAKTQTASKNTKETISIQKKHHMITERKKNFGLEYFELLESGNASEEQLQDCVDRAIQDVAILRDKVTKYKERIATNDAKLDSKLSTTAKFTEPTINITESYEENTTTNTTTTATFTTPAATSSASASPIQQQQQQSPPAASTNATSNPFDNDDNVAATPARPAAAAAAAPTTSTNPFGEEEEEIAVPAAAPVNNGSTNPFEDDDAADVPLARAKVL